MRFMFEIVHAICGEQPEGTEEGYGASVICKNCKTTQQSKHMALISHTMYKKWVKIKLLIYAMKYFCYHILCLL